MVKDVEEANKPKNVPRKYHLGDFVKFENTVWFEVIKGVGEIINCILQKELGGRWYWEYEVKVINQNGNVSFFSSHYELPEHKLTLHTRRKQQFYEEIEGILEKTRNKKAKKGVKYWEEGVEKCYDPAPKNLTHSKKHNPLYGKNNFNNSRINKHSLRRW